MERTNTGMGYGDAVGIRGLGAKRAAAKGAVGVVIRSVGTDDNRLPHTGTMWPAEKGERQIPAAALSVPDAEMLHRILQSKKTARLRMTLGCKMLTDGDSFNVVGDIPGAQRPDEIVLIGAHLDSWDLGTGALDDGAGIGIVVEGARLILASGAKPARTLRVVLFANEENGLAGGKGYAKAHEAELAKHVVAIEADIGTDKVYEARYGGASERLAAFNAMAEDLALLGIARSDKDGEGGSDLGPMRGLGVPTLSLAQDASRYFDIHHTANDTFDKINAEGLAQAATAYAAAALSALTMQGDFGRVPAEKRERHH